MRVPCGGAAAAVVRAAPPRPPVLGFRKHPLVCAFAVAAHAHAMVPLRTYALSMVCLLAGGTSARHHLPGAACTMRRGSGSARRGRAAAAALRALKAA